MARYFFDVTNGHGFEQDKTGQELQSIELVRRETGRILTDIANDEIPRMEKVRVRVDVRDSDGAKVHFGELNLRSGTVNEQ